MCLQVGGTAKEALPPQHPDLVTPNPLPHCELPSTKRAASAAYSVEAVQQDGDDEVVGRVFGGVVSLPTAYATRYQRSAQSRQQPAAPSTVTTSPQTASALEHRNSVVFDNEAQPVSKSNVQLQAAHYVQPASQSSKRHKADSPAVSQQPSQLQTGPSLSPECSAASEGLADAVMPQEVCQAGPDTTQQATIQEARLLAQCICTALAAGHHLSSIQPDHMFLLACHCTTLSLCM